jgi:hypothetical protein
MSEYSGGDEQGSGRTSALRTRLLIPASASVVLAFGGCQDSEQSRYELYYDYCEKFEECAVDGFAYEFEDKVECSRFNVMRVESIGLQYEEQVGADCRDAWLTMSDCYTRVIANDLSCEQLETYVDENDYDLIDCDDEYARFEEFCDE